MPSYLTLPSGRPNPYAPQPQAQAPANPWGQLDPTKPQAAGQRGSAQMAMQGLQYAAQKGWRKQLTQDQQNQLYAHAQANGYQGGDVDSDTYNRGLSYMEQMLGAKGGGNGLDGTPERPAPVGGGLDGTPESQPGNLGNDNAIRQWQQQAPVAGVPNSFRQSNPYAGQQQQLMSRILANPGTMDAKFQNQLSEAQKESASRMQQQAQAQGQQQIAGRGFGSGGGAQQAMTDQNQQNMISQLLAGRRDIATQATQTNRADELNALNASSQLAGQEFTGDMQRAGMALGQMNQNRQANLQDFLGLHGADMDMLRFGQSNEQFNKGFGLDFLRYLAQKDQFQQSLGEQGRQFNNQMGFNWASLSAQQQQQLMSQIFGY